MLTDDELTAIEERANAATPGPWFYNGRVESIGFAHGWICAIGESYREGEGLSPVYNDTAFIIYARDDIPRLLAEIRKCYDALSDIRDEARSFLPIDDDRRDPDSGMYLKDKLHRIARMADEALTAAPQGGDKNTN